MENSTSPQKHTMIQIGLETELLESLKLFSAKHKKSIAAIMREALSQWPHLHTARELHRVTRTL